MQWTKARLAAMLEVHEEEIEDFTVSDDGSVVTVRLVPKPQKIEISIVRRPDDG